MNNVILIGRLVRDPELKSIASSGQANCTFTLAVDKNLSKAKKAEMEQQGKPTADFPRITVWGKVAENCANYLSKGSQVAVQGSIQTGSYTNKDGSKVYTTDVIASNVEFLSTANRQNQGQSQGQKQDPPMQQGFQEAGPNDPFPF